MTWQLNLRCRTESFLTKKSYNANSQVIVVSLYVNTWGLRWMRCLRCFHIIYLHLCLKAYEWHMHGIRISELLLHLVSPKVNLNPSFNMINSRVQKSSTIFVSMTFIVCAFAWTYIKKISRSWTHIITHMRYFSIIFLLSNIKQRLKLFSSICCWFFYLFPHVTITNQNTNTYHVSHH